MLALKLTEMRSRRDVLIVVSLCYFTMITHFLFHGFHMASLGVTPNDVRAALAANNFTSAAGEVKSDFTQVSVNALTSLDSAKAFGQLVIAAHGDALVRLGDVSKIELGPQSSDSSSVFDGLKAVFIGVYSTPTANP